MYFDTRGGGDSLRFLADGLTEALITKLSEVQPLQVISRNGVAPFRGGTVTPDSVARALNVDTLVQGHVARSPDLLRVTVDMIDAGGALISTKTIERPRADVFALQDSVAAEVSTFLRTRLGEQIQMRESRAGTRNGAAWEMLQRARDEVTSADPLIESGDTAALARQWNRADSLFAEAERLDGSRGAGTPKGSASTRPSPSSSARAGAGTTRSSARCSRRASSPARAARRPIGSTSCAARRLRRTWRPCSWRPGHGST